jgi:hypothetical protein
VDIEQLLDDEVIDNEENNYNVEENSNLLQTMQQTYPSRLQPKHGTVNVAINQG